MGGIQKFVGLLVLVSCVQALSWDWEEFKDMHSKQYEDEAEEQTRWGIFQANVAMMEEHNERFKAGEETFEMGINQFTDLLPEEFESQMLSGLNDTKDTEDDDEYTYYEPPEDFQLPRSVNWREKGAVTEVKNQGHCGSCWAFAAVGTLEGQSFRKTGHLVSLSEQNLMDCSRANDGCDGGLASLALKYVMKNGGIDTEKSYRYKAKRYHCHFRRSNVGAKVKSIVRIRKSESKLAAVLAEKGPIAVSLDATPLHHYHRGVLTRKCHKRANHAVTLIGYGTDRHYGDYWLVKNSWGKHFGEEGYFRIARNRGNLCHIASKGLYPEVF